MKFIPTKGEVKEVFQHALRELCISFIVGAVPLLLFPLLKASLTPVPLMQWFALLMAPLALGALLANRFNVRTGPSQRAFKNVFSLFSDVAGSMNTAIQLALGATLGFLILWQSVEPETLTAPNFVGMCVLVIALLLLSTMLSLFLPALRNPRSARPMQKKDDEWLN